MSKLERITVPARGRAEILARLDRTLSELSPVHRPLPQAIAAHEQPMPES
jgi:hypothetical protein